MVINMKAGETLTGQTKGSGSGDHHHYSSQKHQYNSTGEKLEQVQEDDNDEMEMMFQDNHIKEFVDPSHREISPSMLLNNKQVSEP